MRMPDPDQKAIADRAEIAAALRALVPGMPVISDEDERRAYESDGLTAYRQPPLAVVLPGSTAEDALQLLNRIREKVAEIGFHFRGTPVSVTVSCGMTSLRPDDGADDAFDRADKAMYQAKDSGRNRVAQL